MRHNKNSKVACKPHLFSVWRRNQWLTTVKPLVRVAFRNAVTHKRLGQAHHSQNSHLDHHLYPIMPDVPI